MKRVFSLAILAVLVASQPVAAQDFILHANGDSINGELKNLKRGKVSFEIPGGSASDIEWPKIVGIGTAGECDIELTNKRRTFGRVGVGPEPGTAYVIAFEYQAPVDFGNVHVLYQSAEGLQTLHAGLEPTEDWRWHVVDLSDQPSPTM